MIKQNTYQTGLIWTVTLNTIARGLNFLLGVILARSFLPSNTDVYLFVWSVIGVFLIFASGVNLLAISPAYIRSRKEGLETEASKLNCSFLNYQIVPLLFISVVVLFFPYLVFGAFTGFEWQQLERVEPMLRFSGFWLVFVLVNNFLGNLLLSNRFFAASLFGQIIVGLVALVGFILLKESLGVLAFFVGHMAGNIIALVFQIIIIRGNIPFYFTPFHFRLPKSVRRETLSILMTAIPTTVINFMIIAFLSGMGTGSVSGYNYANNLSNLPDAILLSQAVSLAGVKLSEISAGKDDKLLFDTYSRLSLHMFFLMACLGVVVLIAGPDIVAMIYGRNLQDDVFRLTVSALSILIFTLPIKSLDVMNNRLFASYQGLSAILKYNFPLKIFAIILLITLSTVLGFTGILIYLLCIQLIVVALQFTLLSRKFRSLDYLRHIRKLGLVILITGAMYLLCVLCDEYIVSKASPLVRIIFFTLLVGAAALLIERTLRITQFFNMARKSAGIIYGRLTRKNHA